jgi:hypothetical protein
VPDGRRTGGGAACQEGNSVAGDVGGGTGAGGDAGGGCPAGGRRTGGGAACQDGLADGGGVTASALTSGTICPTGAEVCWPGLDGPGVGTSAAGGTRAVGGSSTASDVTSGTMSLMWPPTYPLLAAGAAGGVGAAGGFGAGAVAGSTGPSFTSKTSRHRELVHRVRLPRISSWR